jgi:glycosyltransferase involved in cell wall biosynthesis
MRIAFVHDHRFSIVNNQVYSPGKYSYDLFKLRYLKYFDEVEIVSRKHTKSFDTSTMTRVDGPHIKFTEFPDLSNLWALLNPSQFYPSADKIIDSVDCVIVRLPSEIGNLFADRARLKGVPILVEVVACPRDGLYFNGSRMATLYAPIAARKMRQQLLKATHAIYVTKQFLQDRYPTPGKQIGISDVEITSLSKDVLEKRLEHYQRMHSRPEGPVFTIGTVGSIDNRVKGIDVALRALRLLKNDNIEVKFQVIGPGNQEPYRQLAAELGVESLVDFLGTVGDRVKLFDLLDNLDIYIHPSYMEGLPRAVVEAMSRGCPVIASKVGGIPELVPDHLMHKPGDAQALKSKIAELLGSIDKCQQAARVNFETTYQYSDDRLRDTRDAFMKDFIAKIASRPK